MPSPWKKILTPEAISLQDIICEEVAKKLQIKEENKYIKSVVKECDIKLEFLNEDVAKTGNDLDSYVVVENTQQFEEEYNYVLKNIAKETSNTSISSNDYSRTSQYIDNQSDFEEEESIEDLHERYDLNQFTILKQVAFNDQRDANTDKYLLPSEFQTGDTAEFDWNLSNTVCNSLKLQFKHDQTTGHRIYDKKEDHVTATFNLDGFITLYVYKLVGKRCSTLGNHIIHVGKELVVLNARNDPGYTWLPEQVGLKILKTTLVEFKHRGKYVTEDKRSINKFDKQYTRNTICLWFEKKMLNICSKLQKRKLPCPDVVALKKHKFVLSFSKQGYFFPQRLRQEYILAYNLVLQAMEKFYLKAKLLNANLFKYNIFWYNNQCCFIDASKSVEPSRRDAFEFFTTDSEKIWSYERLELKKNHEILDCIIKSHKLPRVSKKL